VVTLLIQPVEGAVAAKASATAADPV
jgi:hypothetical protein